MMDRYEVIDFTELEKLPQVDVGIGDVILPYMELKEGISSVVPPFHPMRFMSYIKDQDIVPMMYHPSGSYHTVDLGNFSSLLKLPGINHPLVVEWIEELKKEFEGWYVHPEFGSFNLDRIDVETKVYDASGGTTDEYRKKNEDFVTAVQQRREDFDQYTILENAVYVKEVRKWYPDFLPT
jgi:hypothetical protein